MLKCKGEVAFIKTILLAPVSSPYPCPCPYFTKVSFSPQVLFPENEEISAPPPCGLLNEIYLFYENWSTETFREE
jgi:hypothetical protein